MKQLSPASIPPEVRAWFDRQIEHLAMRHDLAGPQINCVRRGKYLKELIREFKRRAVAARQRGELATAAEALEVCCQWAAGELIALRQISADHRAGRLPTKSMRQLPAYAAFKAYLDEAPALLLPELMGAARELEPPTQGADLASPPLARPGPRSQPVSPETRAWMEVQALGVALADDAGGAPLGSVPKEAYITHSALRIRAQARRALAAGTLKVPAGDLDQICWEAACMVFLLRSLKAARQAGELTGEAIKKMPIYGPYRDYFDRGAELAAMARGIAAAVGQPMQPPGGQN